MSTSDLEEPANWRRRQRPLRLECRLEFEDYDATRDFLERSEVYSEQSGIYPNMSFGRTYVNLTLFAEEGSEEITPEQFEFAERINAMAERNEDESQ